MLMLSAIFLLMGCVIMLGIVVALVAASRTERTYALLRGWRLVTCPATGGQAAVDIDAGKAAIASIGGEARIEVLDCSLWPQRRACAQTCGREVEESPVQTLVWNHFERWYAGESCALCGKPFGKVNSKFHRPGLLGSDSVTHEWDEVPAKDLPEALTTSKRICWNCHMRETFLRKFPEIARYAETSLRSPHA